MTSLAARQDIILDKLKELKGQLETMKASHRVCAKPAQNNQTQTQKSTSHNKNTAAASKPPQGRCKPKVSFCWFYIYTLSFTESLRPFTGQCPRCGDQLQSRASATELPVAATVVEE